MGVILTTSKKRSCFETEILLPRLHRWTAPGRSEIGTRDGRTFKNKNPRFLEIKLTQPMDSQLELLGITDYGTYLQGKMSSSFNFYFRVRNLSKVSGNCWAHQKFIPLNTLSVGVREGLNLPLELPHRSHFELPRNSEERTGRSKITMAAKDGRDGGDVFQTLPLRQKQTDFLQEKPNPYDPGIMYFSY